MEYILNFEVSFYDVARGFPLNTNYVIYGIQSDSHTLPIGIDREQILGLCLDDMFT